MLKFDSTSLDMLSIPRGVAQLLLGAPEACFKLYIFALLYPEGDMETLSASSGLEKNQIMSACEWLCEHGAARIDGNSFILLAPEPAPAAESAVFEENGLWTVIGSLFGERQLTYNNCRTLFELVEFYELPEAVLPVLVEYCIAKHPKGRKLPISYIAAQGKLWAQSGVTTLERAAKMLSEGEAVSEDISGLFRIMGWKRLPTAPEREMYARWEEMGFTFDSIRAATAATTASSSPSMAYLNSIIENLASLSLYTPSAISAHFAHRAEDDKRIKELLRVIGARSLAISAAQRALYESWRERGVPSELVLFAAERAAAGAKTRFSDIDAILNDWLSRGLLTPEDVEQHIAAQRLEMQNTIELFSRAGVRKGISAADIKLLKKFTEEYGFSTDIVLYAAECAYGLSHPLRSVDKILQRWKERGISSLEQAEAENRAFFASRGTAPPYLKRENASDNIIVHEL